MKKLTILIILLLLLLISCSNSSVSDSSSDVYTDEMTKGNPDLVNTIDLNQNHENYTNLESKKLIRDFSIELETKTYDEALKIINENITNNDGYIQSFSEYNNNVRYASYVIRVPSDKSEAYVNDLSSLGKITSKINTTNDITDAYMDIEARLKSLYIEETTYQNLLLQSQSVSDVLEIQSALSDTRYQIEMYESQKRNYDLLVSYDTINLKVKEVEKISIDDQSVFQKIGILFNDSITNLINIVQNSFVYVIGNILYIFIIVVLLLLIFKLIKYFKKKKRKII